MLPVPGTTPFGLPAPSLRRPVLSGFAVALFLGVLAVWSLFAELSSAAVARGTSLVDSQGEPAISATDPAAQARLPEWIAQLGEEIALERARLEAALTQQAFIETERQHLERLYDPGYARLPRLLELQLAAADLEVREQSARGKIARLREEIAAATHALQTAPAARHGDTVGGPQQALALDAGF